MDRRRLLFCAHTHSDSMPCPWFCVEIVRPFPPHAYESWSDLAHSYRRTYRPAPYHIAQELQKYNIPDYRPRQEQYVPSPLLIYLGNFYKHCPPQIPKSDQESSGGATYAPQPRLCFQSDRECGTTGSSQVDQSIRYVKIECTTFGILVRFSLLFGHAYVLLSHLMDIIMDTHSIRSMTWGRRSSQFQICSALTRLRRINLVE